MLRLVCFCVVEDGRYGRPNLSREGGRWHSCCYPCCCRGMDVVVVKWSGSCWVRAWFSCSCSLCIVTFVPSAGEGAVVRAPVAPRLARGLHVSLGRDKSTPRGSGAPVLTLQWSGEAEIVPNGALGSGALMTSWGLGRGRNQPQASGDLTADVLLMLLVGYV
jgi:hypothetical protein